MRLHLHISPTNCYLTSLIDAARIILSQAQARRFSDMSLSHARSAG